MTESFKSQSYSQLVRKQLGRAADIYLQASIIINNAGMSHSWLHCLAFIANLSLIVQTMLLLLLFKPCCFSYCGLFK